MGGFAGEAGEGVFYLHSYGKQPYPRVVSEPWLYFHVLPVFSLC